MERERPWEREYVTDGTKQETREKEKTLRPLPTPLKFSSLSRALINLSQASQATRKNNTVTKAFRGTRDACDLKCTIY